MDDMTGPAIAETSFTAAGGIVPLNFSVNPSYPGKFLLQSGIARTLTEGGTEYAYRKGAFYGLYTLSFEGMPAADFDGGFDYKTSAQAEGTQSLVNWFVNVAPPGAAGFTYKDPFGSEHAVSFAEDKLEFSLTDNGLYGGTVVLKEILGGI